MIKLQQFALSDPGKNIDKYAIWVEAKNPLNPNGSAENYTQLYYCGFASSWGDKDCAKWDFVCSIPGPIFYI